MEPIDQFNTWKGFRHADSLDCELKHKTVDWKNNDWTQ